MATVTTDALLEILLNKQQGAADLLRQAVDWLVANPESLSIDEADKTLRLLRRTRPAMAGFSVLARRIENAWRQNPDRNPADILRVIQSTLNEADAEVADLFKEILKKKGSVSLVTLSHSSTVRSSLRYSKEHVSELHVLESEPGGEGRVLAKSVEEFLPAVTVHADAEIEAAVAAAEMGVMGADTVFADGAVLNKVLSAKLADLLHAQDKPLYVLATSWKESDRRSDDQIADPETLFELVPADRITDVISEQ